MRQLNVCASKLPAARQTEIQIPLNWMNAGFEHATKPMPDSYRASLEGDVALCEAALNNPSKTQLLDDLVGDLRQKGRDCAEAGWYRSIRVQVEVTLAGKPDPGWEVFYLWIPGRHIANVQKVRYKALSPAEESLPPGLYTFQARKGQLQSEETRVAVVSKDPVLCQIPVQ